jgi:hypothetical protein
MVVILIAEAGARAAVGTTLSPEVEFAFKLLAIIGAVLGALATAVAFFLKRHWDNRDRESRAVHERDLAALRATHERDLATLRSAHERELAAQQEKWTRERAESQAARDRELAKEASRDRLRDILYESLRWFEKGTQRRSIGISIVEASWDLFPEFRTVWLAVFANQAVYLLAVSKQKEKAHEVANLVRIMQLVVRHKSSVDPVAFQALRDALRDRIEGRITKGLSMDGNVLKEWRDALTSS